MKVESIAVSSLGAFCNTFDLHQAIIGLGNQFLVFFLSGCSRQVLQYLPYTKIDRKMVVIFLSKNNAGVCVLCFIYRITVQNECLSVFKK